MEIPQNLSPNLIDEYNRCYEKGFKLLSKCAIIQDSERRHHGSVDRNQIKKACELTPNDNVNRNVLSYIKEVINGRKEYPDKI
jgi:hypothetical protein